LTHSIQDTVAERWSLALRPARSSDGDALQNYVRGLSPQSRYNRFLGAASELPASELARALAANGRDTQTLLLTSTAEDPETVVGEARVAFWCAKRAGEFSMSIADDWRRLGLGSALLQEIERKAAADGIELLFGDTLRTNEGMIGLARRRGFRLGPGFEPRLVRIQKRLGDAVSRPAVPEVERNCPGPAAQQKFEFLFPPDECGQSGRVKDVKPALDGTRAQRRPGPHAGHINLRSSLERGKLGPRVQTSVSRSSCFR
jgi:GNAT superfamily N-acetyltransferase